MTESAADIAIRLDGEGVRSTTDESFNELHQRLDFFRRTHYEQYIPTIGPDFPDFETRLAHWLKNAADDDQARVLFELAPRITFLTREDFLKLHQEALAGPITRWLIDQLGLSLDDPNLDDTLSDELDNRTWFTAITDSMGIADFHHANNLGGIDFRPDWRSLATFGDADRIREFIEGESPHGKQALKRIVILEDFVGSGTQMMMGKGSVSFAASSFPDVPILLVPLVICPDGVAASKKLAAAYDNLTYESVLELGGEDLVTPTTPPDANDAFANLLFHLAAASYANVVGDDAAWPRPYDAYGLAQTGALLVLYSNTPANTLPLIQHSSSDWAALFPRSARIR